MIVIINLVLDLLKRMILKVNSIEYVRDVEEIELQEVVGRQQQQRLRKPCVGVHYYSLHAMKIKSIIYYGRPSLLSRT